MEDGRWLEALPQARTNSGMRNNFLLVQEHPPPSSKLGRSCVWKEVELMDDDIGGL